MLVQPDATAAGGTAGNVTVRWQSTLQLLLAGPSGRRNSCCSQTKLVQGTHVQPQVHGTGTEREVDSIRRVERELIWAPWWSCMPLITAKQADHSGSHPVVGVPDTYSPAEHARSPRYAHAPAEHARSPRYAHAPAEHARSPRYAHSPAEHARNPRYVRARSS
jgi:hypothetical protein